MKVKTITCPNCTHANNFLAEDCSQCGINFSKYYEELEKAEALRRHIEEQEKAEALRKQQQAEEARQETEKRAEMLRRQKEELEKARRKKEDETRAEEERRRREEAEKAEALLKQQEEEEARRAEASQRRREEEARAEEERRRREEAEKAEALRRQQQEEEARRAEASQHRREEEARIPTDEPQENMPQPVGANAEGARTSGNRPDFRAADTLQIRLSPYDGQMIGITYGDPSEIQNVKLISVNADHIQVFYPISKNIASYPYRQLILVTENTEGISAVGPDISPVFPVVIEVPRPFFHQP